MPPRRLVITVCPREAGSVALAVERGQRERRLDARAIVRVLGDLVAARGVEDRVEIREACAGGCSGPGPNVGVEVYAAPPPGARPDRVAIDWKTYVYSIASLDCLATIIDENLGTPRRRAAR
jgi:hypothetical protein